MQYIEMKKPNSNILELGYLQAKIVPEIAVKWYEIGLELDIPASKLNTIKNETDHCDARCFEMLQMWLNRGENAEEFERPSWKNMEKAMRAVELNFRADNLKKLILEEYMRNDNMDTGPVDIN